MWKLARVLSRDWFILLWMVGEKNNGNKYILSSVILSQMHNNNKGVIPKAIQYRRVDGLIKIDASGEGGEE